MNTNVYNKIVTSEKTNISTSGVPISDTSYNFRHGLQIQARSTNMSTIFLGQSNLTASSGVNCGFPLVAGASINLPFDNPANLYAIAVSGSNSSLVWLGI